MEDEQVPTYSLRLDDVIAAAHALSLEELGHLEKWIQFRRARQQERERQAHNSPAHTKHRRSKA
jgi:hypothetical protein